MSSISTRHQDLDSQINHLLRIIEDISRGVFSGEIYTFTDGQNPEIIRRLAEAIGMMMVSLEAREQRINMDNQKLRDLNDKIRKDVTSMVITISSALGARDKYTEGHNQRTAGYSMRLSRRVGLSRDKAEYIYIGALLHDIGKIGFSDRMFSSEDFGSKPGLLEEIRKHPEIGSSILYWLDFLGPVKEYVLYHHERMDGTGYPRGLTGDQIPLGAKIIAIADTFDAITTDRPYQKGRTPLQAMEILESMAGSKLDKNLVTAFCLEIRENGME